MSCRCGKSDLDRPVPSIGGSAGWAVTGEAVLRPGDTCTVEKTAPDAGILPRAGQRSPSRSGDRTRRRGRGLGAASDVLQPSGAWGQAGGAAPGTLLTAGPAGALPVGSTGRTSSWDLYRNLGRARHAGTDQDCLLVPLRGEGVIRARPCEQGVLSAVYGGTRRVRPRPSELEVLRKLIPVFAMAPPDTGGVGGACVDQDDMVAPDDGSGDPGDLPGGGNPIVPHTSFWYGQVSFAIPTNWVDTYTADPRNATDPDEFLEIFWSTFYDAFRMAGLDWATDVGPMEPVLSGVLWKCDVVEYASAGQDARFCATPCLWVVASSNDDPDFSPPDCDYDGGFTPSNWEPGVDAVGSTARTTCSECASRTGEVKPGPEELYFDLSGGSPRVSPPPGSSTDTEQTAGPGRME